MTELASLKDLRQKKRDLENETKDVNEAIASLVFDLVEYMEITGQPGLKLDGVGTVSLTHTKKYSIEDPVSFEQWMVANGELEFVMAVHAQKVHGYYKERLENDQELPPGIKTFVKSNVTIRSA